MIRSPPMRFESEQPPPPPPPPPSRGAFSVEGHRCVHERCATWPLVKRCTQYSSVKHACATRPFGPVFIVLAHRPAITTYHAVPTWSNVSLAFTLRGWGSRWTKNVYRNTFFFKFFKRDARKIDAWRGWNCFEECKILFRRNVCVIIKFLQILRRGFKLEKVKRGWKIIIISIKLITSRVHSFIQIY